MPRPHFRAAVVAVVRRQDGKVLAFERSDHHGEWQLPQGGIDSGESPQEAAWRELKEETGLGRKSVRLVDEYPYWTVYEWRKNTPRSGRYGQAHRWFIFEPVSDDITPTPDGREFRDWRWMKPKRLVSDVVKFRRKPYAEVFAWIAEHFGTK